MRRTGRRRRTGLLVASGGLVIGVIVGVLVWFQPQRLFINFVSLGRLQGNQGNQNYEIAAGVDLRRYRSVVIWCRRFTYAFGAAPLR